MSNLGILYLLELEPAAPCALCHRLDPAVIQVPASVEHHSLDSFVQRSPRCQLAYRASSVRLFTVACPRFERRCSDQGLAQDVVDHLHMDVS